MPGVIILPTADETDKINGYKIGTWRARLGPDIYKDYPNYECIYCQYATLWIEKIKKHLDKGNHPWPYPNPDNDFPLSPFEEGTDAEY